jgi:hypothetical protein
MHLFDLLGFGDAAAHGLYTEVEQVDRRLAGAEGDGDLVSRLGERPGDGETDSAVAAGDQD